MVNPFNRDFFKLVLGFTIILTFSCSLLFFITKYNINFDNRRLIANEKEASLNK